MDYTGNYYWGNTQNGAHFSGPFGTKEDAYAEACFESEPEQDIYIGKSHTVRPSVCAESLIEMVCEDLYESTYEDAIDCWCMKIEKEKLEALSKELTDVLLKHLEQWGEETSWEVISDPEKVR